MNLLQEISQVSSNNWTIHTNARAYRRDQNVATFLPARCVQGPSLDLYEKEMHEAAVRHQADIDEIRKIFVMQDNIGVTSFLHDHRTIPQLLLQAVPHLKERFGSDTVFVLRALIDESGFSDLYAVAMWPGKAHDAIEALDRFVDQWWIGNARPAAGYLNFTYELV